ncbi:hypothetical protein LTR66_011379 [Elasticomyces elasticus]|nr:hypothetical protein LTR66_011379 [Elasticomyces elasticus]
MPPTLMTLPAELRIQIYEYLLDNSEKNDGNKRVLTLWHRDDRGYHRDDRRPKLSDLAGFSPAILGTCRRIYEEALPVLYATKTFEIRFCWDWIKYEDFLDAVGQAGRYYIRHVRVLKETKSLGPYSVDYDKKFMFETLYAVLKLPRLVTLTYMTVPFNGYVSRPMHYDPEEPLLGKSVVEFDIRNKLQFRNARDVRRTETAKISEEN